jgi:uncharacterized protein YndB with AHSA1/START domain
MVSGLRPMIREERTVDKTMRTYVTYVATSQDKLWAALVDPGMTTKYWQHVNESDWRQGSRWAHRRCDEERTIDLVGEVLEIDPPRRLILSWADPSEEGDEGKFSRVTFEIEPYMGVARMTVTHDRLEEGSEMLEGITDGWPKVLSSLKSLLETGRPLPKLW